MSSYLFNKHFKLNVHGMTLFDQPDRFDDCNRLFDCSVTEEFHRL